MFHNVTASNGVGVVVPTYNPDTAALLITMQQLAAQSDMVVVCDNTESADISAEIKRLCNLVERTVFLPMGGNRGIAAAQNVGIRWLISRGCGYVLEMDQDAFLAADYVENMLRAHRTFGPRRIAGIGAVPIDLNARRKTNAASKAEPRSSLRNTDKCLSAGFFLSADAFLTVGPKDESLFIDYVDWEWCWRARRAGLESYVHSGLSVTHRLGERRVGLGPIKAGVPSPVRHYYQYRNSLLLMGKPHVPTTWKLERLLVNAVKLPLYSLCGSDRRERRGFILQGIKDALTGRTGKYSARQKNEPYV